MLRFGNGKNTFQWPVKVRQSFPGQGHQGRLKCWGIKMRIFRDAVHRFADSLTFEDI